MGFGAPRQHFHRYKFEVEIDGIGSAEFMSCSELSVEAETIAIHEGGGNKPTRKDPGKLTFEPITLRRGATTDIDVYAWFLSVAEASTGHGAPEPTIRRGVSILQKDRTGATVRRWDLVDGWAKKFIAGSWDASASEAVIEELVIEFDHFLLGQ